MSDDRTTPGERAPAALAGRDAWPLELRLAGITFTMLVVVLLVFGTAAYRSVRASAVARAVDRLGAVARGLAESSARTNLPRVATLQNVAATDAVQQTLGAPARRSSQLPPRIAQALTVGAIPDDSTWLGYALLRVSGERPFDTAILSTPRDSLILARTASDVVRSRTPYRSPLYVTAGEVRYWNVVPVPARTSDSASIGVIAELRRVRNPPHVEDNIRKLIGDETRLFLTSRGSAEWLTVRGAPIAAPMTLAIPAGEVHMVPDTRGVAHYAVQAPVAGSPWLIVLMQSEQSVLLRPHALLRRFVLVGLLVLLLGTAGVWLLCRRESRPMVRLRDAALALTRGDYATRVAPAGGAELVTLGRTFNDMAVALGTAHASLAEQNEALVRANEELVRANEAKARFLAVMSHELRTPLNAIGGYLELLTLGLYGPTTGEQQEGFARIKRSQGQLLALITDVLEYSRLDAGHLTLRRAEVSVGEQFAVAAETMAEQFVRKGVTLDVAPSASVVFADPTRLQQVVLNLMTNALRFTDEGGVVQLSAEGKGEITEIRVRDDGVGIEEKDRAMIFEPFVQLDSSLTRRTGGVGLGLTIVRDLTLAMGGSVRVESVRGEGSTFIVSLETVGRPGRAAANDLVEPPPRTADRQPQQQAPTMA